MVAVGREIREGCGYVSLCAAIEEENEINELVIKRR
jgi:hypothetical protein